MDKDQQHSTYAGVSPELLAAAVAATDAGVLICDRSLRDTPIIFANDAFSRITGYARQEILGRNCRFLQGAGTDRAEVARLRAAIEAGQPAEVELLNYRKDGGRCQNVELPFEGSMQQCALFGQQQAARWVVENQGWQMRRGWRCLSGKAA